MEAGHLIAFNLALLAAMASPGPALLLALRTNMAQGRAAGLATGYGLGIMAASWTLAALLGLAGLFALFPWAYLAVKIAGAGYLLYVAFHLWRDARTPIEEAPATPHRAFISGLLVNLSNPKAVLFAAAVLLVVFPPELTLTEKLIITGNHLIVECVVYTGFAFAVSQPAISRRYLGAKLYLDRVASGMLAALGLKLLFDR